MIAVSLFLCCLVMSKLNKSIHSVSPADKIPLYFPSIKILLNCQKEEDLLPLFHKMLEGLSMGEQE